MGVMYNSPCVLNHPSGPEEARSVSLSTWLQNVAAWYVFTHTQVHYLENNNKYAHVIKNTTPPFKIFFANTSIIRTETRYYTHTTVAVAQINI